MKELPTGRTQIQPKKVGRADSGSSLLQLLSLLWPGIRSLADSSTTPTLQYTYYYGVAEALIHANFADPDFTDCAARDRSHQEDINTYFGSRDFEQLDHRLSGLISR